MEAELDALFAPWAGADGPGLVVGVLVKGEVAYRKAFGMASLETGVALNPKTKMRLGSVSKHFTALLSLLMAQEGRLDLDEPIRTYLPELVGPGGDPSVRQLLQHRGGSRCYLDLGFIAQGMAMSPPGEALARQVRQTGRNFAPGQAMIYNNGGYHLVSLAIERVTGVDFAGLIKARLFDPLGMADTACVGSDYVITPGMATLHLAAADGGWRRGLFPTEDLRGEGALVSSLDDMFVWMRHLRARDRFGAPASWRALLERPVCAPGQQGAYALGLILDDYRGRPTARHSGGVVGGSSHLMMFTKDDVDIVILSNGARGASPAALSQDVADILLGERLDLRPAAVLGGEYPGLSGTWWSPETGMLYGFTDSAGALTLSVCGSPSGLPLTRHGGSLVCASSGLGDIDVDLAGLPSALSIRFGGQTALYHRPQAPETLDGLARWAGAYVSHDADCEAYLTLEPGHILIRFKGAHGCVTHPVHRLGPDLGVVRADQAGEPFTMALSFAADGDPCGRFHLNTARTRQLVFERAGPRNLRVAEQVRSPGR